MLSVPETLIRVNNKFSDFKVLTVARKLSQITDLDSYNFDSDFETNSENAECMIVGSGELGTGLFTRNAPPTWQDFEQYATICQVIEDPIKSSISGDYCFCSGNQAQNAGQTNYYFDCQQMAVTNLPQFDYSRIHAPNDNYVWAFDVWLTPFKPYTFALFQWGSATYFQWYGGGKLIQPSFVDGGSLPGDEPILSGDDTFIRIRETGVRYYSGVFPQQVSWNTVYPSNIKIVPAVMDNKIALNINWFMTTNNTNMVMGHNLACSNTYRDDTTISGGTLQDDILYEGILKKYYGENEGVEGEEEQPVFERTKVLIRERTYLQSTHLVGVGDPILTWANNGAVDTTQGKLSDNFVSDFNGTIIAPCEANDLNNNGDLDYFKQAFKDHSCDFPLGQMSVPYPDFPNNYIHSYYYTVYNPQDSNINTVGTYLKSTYTSQTSSGESRYLRALTYQPSFSNNTTALDDEYNTQYYANYDGCKNNEAMEIKWHDDGLLHIFDIWIDEPSYEMGINSSRNYDYPTNQITFAITYNNRYLLDTQGGVDNQNAYSPYWFWQRINTYQTGNNGQNFWYPYYYYFKDFGFATIKGGSNGFYDTPYRWLSTFPFTGNRTHIYNINEAPPVIYCFACETPYSENNNTVYRNNLMIMTNAEQFADVTYAGNQKQYLYAISLPPYYDNDNNRNVADPMQKGDNGHIPRPNPDENAGAGCDDKSPESIGTNRTHVEPAKILPPITTNIFASGLLSLYSIDNANLTKLGGDLFSNNIFEQIEHGVQKPIDCILRVAESRISPIVESTPRAIKLGSATLSAFGNRATKTYRTINCGEVLIKRINGDYTDNDEKIMVYLPYIGFKQLDGNMLQNTKVKLEYIFNFLNGNCIANILWTPVEGNPVYENAKGKWAYLTSFTGEFITTFPIGTSSNTGLLSTLMSAGLGVMTHNAYYARAAIRSAPNSFYPTFEHTGEFGANCSNMINILQPYIYKFSLRHTFPHNSIGNTKKENTSGKINGLFTSKYVTISEDIYTNNGIINGFIQCDNFELKNTPTSITADECEILKNLFNEGVWIE